MLLGLRTAIYRTPDLEAGKRWYTKVLGVAPYFDQPFYVGYNVGGYELGLLPDATLEHGGRLLGREGHRESRYARLLELGAEPRTEVQDVGEGILAGDVLDPFGNVFGIIENPHFKLPAEAVEMTRPLKQRHAAVSKSRCSRCPTRMFPAIRCWDACCSSRNSAAISSRMRAARCCPRARTRAAPPATSPSITSPALSGAGRAVSCCSTAAR